MCNKVCVVICVTVLTLATDVVQGHNYQYLPSIKGWIKPYKLAETCDVAFNKCRDQGAELMAPLTKNMAAEMKRLIGDNNHSTAYFIDAKARYVSGIYICVPIQDMPVTELIDSLNGRDGNCLSMDSHQIRVVSCTSELPYICYRENMENDTDAQCGTSDKEYQYNEVTDSCYKLHDQFLTWQEAYTTCIDEGSYLAIINDAQEVEVLKQMFDYIGVYVGIQALNGDAIWTSIHGEPMDTIYNIWWKEFHKHPKRRCGILIISIDHSDLIGARCDNEEYFLCEKDSRHKILSKTQLYK